MLYKLSQRNTQTDRQTYYKVALYNSYLPIKSDEDIQGVP